MKTEYPFVVPFFEINCEFFNEIKNELIDTILEIHNSNPFELLGKFPELSNLKKNITESDHNFFNIKNNSIQKLGAWIGQSLIEGYGKINIKTSQVTFRESWFHVAKKGGYHNVHYHVNTPLAGIFYIQNGGSEIGNRWLNPIPGYIDEYSSKWCKTKYDTKFLEGKLVLFPGWLLHSAVPHEGDDLRIVLAFNSIPK
jgi:hypothetical protein